jgi:Raf kinase inhibitor-like YbhB/YbcL family protein
MKYFLIALPIALFFMALAADAGEIDMQKLDVKLGFDKVPDKFTCNGLDISPKIEIKGLNAASVAIIMEDPDAPSGNFVHWTIWNILPADTIPEAIPKGEIISKPISAVQGKNSADEIGYIGPCPPRGKPHRYFFRVYALDSFLDTKAGASKAELERAMSGHILQKGEAMATYQN